MVETAILKVFSTEPLWQGVNDTSRSTAGRPISAISPSNG